MASFGRPIQLVASTSGNYLFFINEVVSIQTSQKTLFNISYLDVRNSIIKTVDIPPINRFTVGEKNA
jgi:hypothetical protein